MEWSEITSDRSVSYRLSDGHYRFIVEALTRDDPDNAATAAFSLTIQKPFTERWWFILAVLAVVAFVVYVIIRLRERAHRKQREFLEEELSKRTAEVFEQKEELAQKNLDITESIKYAKRIQSSVLPDTSRLGSVFSEAFVFFLPRDIVSGDFFWFDWTDKDKFVVVCSDSTGHGVPGAFMSMIGTALLQDIITVKKITRPSQVLHELDSQIFSTLNQNQELESSNDGMDITVCEFNMKTKQLVFASAMRPVILVIDGEQQYVRGNRSSVGGESYTEKFFDDQEYHLREGDLVYLFTDGYCDQFGGDGGKKMKVSRLRTLVDDIKSLPMDQQGKQVSDYFTEWQGKNEQVDDVLFMGIRI
jgi:serine phosphatase RsbU (regulator of sigma subunit)